MGNGTVVSGVICELNPLHNGHQYLLEQLKTSEHGGTVCVMSGNFVQRGECAVLDKWSRTEAALEAGADLVLELPLPFAVSGAETFARGGIAVLEGLNCVDRLAFGSECGEIGPLLTCAGYLLSEEFRQELKETVNGSVTFAKARSDLVVRRLGPFYGELLTKSNNILGVEYCKALLSSGSRIEPYTLRRHGAGHGDGPQGEFAGASYLREQLKAGKEIRAFVPECTAKLFDTAKPADLERAERAIFYRLRTASPEELMKIPDVSEGIEQKLIRAARETDSLESLYAAVKSKRYSHARIRRIVLSALLGIERRHTQKVPYLRVLGMTRRGESMLKNSTLPVVCSYSDVKKLDDFSREMFALEARAGDLYGLMTDPIAPAGRDFTMALIKRP